jgi:hypothetical protein
LIGLANVGVAALLDAVDFDVVVSFLTFGVSSKSASNGSSTTNRRFDSDSSSLLSDFEFDAAALARLGRPLPVVLVVSTSILLIDVLEELVLDIVRGDGAGDEAGDLLRELRLFEDDELSFSSVAPAAGFSPVKDAC